jgi:hypothetical protein
MFLTLLVVPAAYALWRRHQVREPGSFSATPRHDIGMNRFTGLIGPFGEHDEISN